MTACSPTRYVWIEHAEERPDHLLLVAGPGYCSFDRKTPGYAHPQDIAHGRVPGAVLSINVIAKLAAPRGESQAFVLRERTGTAVESLRWEFPFTMLPLHDLPELTVLNLLRREIRLTQWPVELDWVRAVVRTGGRPTTYVRGDRIDEMALRCFRRSNAWVAYYPVVLGVNLLDGLSAQDRTAQRRHLRLFSTNEVSELYARKMLSSQAAAVWAHAVEEGAVF